MPDPKRPDEASGRLRLGGHYVDVVAACVAIAGNVALRLAPRFELSTVAGLVMFLLAPPILGVVAAVTVPVPRWSAAAGRSARASIVFAVGTLVVWGDVTAFCLASAPTASIVIGLFWMAVFVIESTLCALAMTWARRVGRR